MNTNLILMTDSYKASHWLQYPKGTTGVYSYIESRGGVYPYTVFFGLQSYIKEYLSKPITQEMIDEAAMIFGMHGEPFNREGWEYILREYNGYLPVRIKAVPEGTVVPTKNVLVTIENTDPACYWLTSYLETGLLRAVWYGSTVATQSYAIKLIIKAYLEETGDPAGLPFKLHDFGARGVSSAETAGLGGLAHLVNFLGTDTVEALVAARRYYGATIAGFSIPAAEHSTITAWGREGEVDAYRNMLTQYGGPGKILAVVSDSYDIHNAVDKLWGEELKQAVIDSGATVVIRPDSGDPVEVNMQSIESLGAKFGYTVNSKGYKVLNHVRLIQGDGVNIDTINNILHAFKQAGWSADNIAFGMGGALLQQVNRDTQKFAMKASAVCINDQWVGISKDPVTDPGKRSKQGRWTLYRDLDGKFYSGVEDWMTPVLRTVFENGSIVQEYTLDQVRANSEK